MTACLVLKKKPIIPLLTATLANLKNIQHEPFMNLFRHINGENDRQERLTMSKPVVTMFIRDKTKSNIRSVGMLFYLFAENPPKPYDPRITITEMIPLKVYIRAFGGSDTSSAVLRRELETLYEDLVCADLVEKSDFNHPFLAEYAHPWASRVAKIFRFTCTLFWSIPTYSRTLLQSFSEK